MNRLVALFFATALVLTACADKSGGDAAKPGGDTSAGETAKPAIDKNATVAIDGSSTVYPITEAVAEEFGQDIGGRVTIGVSGTGGGFKKFCHEETSISGASRPIKPSEVEACKKSGVEYIELPVAYDGIAVVVNPQNDWVDHLTVEELKTIWAPESQDKVKTWNQVREGWPAEEIHLFGPGVDSGTYDYFTKAIVGTEHSSRGDFTSSEDDNVLVQGVSSDKLAIGFFGFAYYAENQKKLKLVPVEDGNDENGKGPIAPSHETVADGTYQPLSRPVFIYVNKAATERPEVDAFVDYYVAKVGPLADEVGYIALPETAAKLVVKRYDDRVTGSLFEGHGSKVGATVEKLLGGK